jgi:tellurite resistance protein TehA-like permease
MSALHHIPILRWVGLAFPDLIGSDSCNLNRVSFTAVMPLEMIALGTARQLYLGTPRAAFAVSMSLSVLEGYLLYTRKEISGGDLTYALVIPPISVSTGMLLAPSLVQIAPGLAPLVDFLVAGGLRGELHALHIHRIPGARRLALMIAITFWGFELWNVLVMTAASAASLRGRPPMSVWAYLFPLTIAAGIAIAVAILPLWAYSVYASALLLRRLISLSRAPAPADVAAEGEEGKEGGKSP